MAGKQSRKLRKWFDREIYGKALEPHYVDEAELERRKAQKTYREGQNEFGGETLDASKCGVTNIAEAVELFARRTGL